MIMNNIKGNAYILGDDINTDDIVPSHTLTMRDAEEMAQHTLEYKDPNFAQNAKGSIIVAGKNFGTGSSREEAVHVLKILGIKAVIAKSFSRIYFRNLINNGIIAIYCNWKDSELSMGDKLEISIKQHKILNKSKQLEIPFKKIPQFIKDVLKSGGILNQLKQNLH